MIVRALAAALLAALAVAGCGPERPPAPAAMPLRPAVSSAADWLERHQDVEGAFRIRTFRRRCTDASCDSLGVAEAADACFTGLGAVLLSRARPPREAAATRAIRAIADWTAADGTISSPQDRNDKKYVAYNQAAGVLALVEGVRSGVPGAKEALARAFPVLAALSRKATTDDSVGIMVVALAAAGPLAGDPEGKASDAALLDLEKIPCQIEVWIRGGADPAVKGWRHSACISAIACLRPPVPADARAHLLSLPPRLSRADYYEWWYGAQALARDPDPGALAWRERCAEYLTDLQETKGCARGSFAPIDRWSYSGGRLYATIFPGLALAAIADAGTGERK